MNSAAPVVIKLGGSLLATPQIPVLMKTISSFEIPVIVVPGGGPFADAVRNAQQKHEFPDELAHNMAMHAMVQCGQALAAQSPGSFTQIQGISGIRTALKMDNSATSLTKAARPPHLLWLPDVIHDLQSAEKSWRTSSDSLALMLAVETGAERLFLVKACNAPEQLHSWEQLSSAGIVDQAFPENIQAFPNISVTLIYNACAHSLHESVNSETTCSGERRDATCQMITAYGERQ